MASGLSPISQGGSNYKIDMFPTVMPKTIPDFIDESLRKWEDKKLNCHPDEVPELMQTGKAHTIGSIGAPSGTP
jgi:hypothetical protein